MGKSSLYGSKTSLVPSLLSSHYPFLKCHLNNGIDAWNQKSRTKCRLILFSYCEVGKMGQMVLISLYKLILYNLRDTAIRTRPEVRILSSDIESLDHCCNCSHFSCVQALWLGTVACRAPLSMGFSRRVLDWVGMPPPGDLPDRDRPESPALQAGRYHWATREAPLDHHEQVNPSL